MRKLCLMLVFLLPAVAVGQSMNLPAPAAGTFVVTSSPLRDGIRATADLPTSQHHRNVGGSDGEGLCVYTSAWHAALWQSASELYGFRDWMTKRPGGSYPDKFEKTLNDYCREKGIPAPQYVQHTGGDDEFLTLVLKTGRMACVTYCGVDGQGRYGNEVIGHMVNLVHLDATRAAILDNNFPGTWLWMSRADFLCRWRGVQADGRPFLGRDKRGRQFPIGGGWAIVLLQAPPPPYPTQPPVQFQVKGGCVCGDDCKCKDGDCPAKCPVIVGQFRRSAQPFQSQDCPDGKCPLQQPARLPAFPTVVPVPAPAPALVADDSQGRWVPSGNGEWGYWIGGKRIAAVFPDGRVEATNENGIANGVRIFPPAPLPPGIVTQIPQQMPAPVPVPVPNPVQANPPLDDHKFPDGGVMPERLTSRTEYRHNGEPTTKEFIEAVLAITDDSERWNLTIVGEPHFATKVRTDLSALPVSVRAKLHIQSYTASDWAVGQFKLGEGVTLRKPAVGRVGGDVGTVPIADYTAARLGELLASEQGPTPKPQPAPSPKPKEPTPDVKPSPVVPDVKPVDPKPHADPVPQPQPTTPSTPTWPFLVGIGVILYLIWRK